MELELKELLKRKFGLDRWISKLHRWISRKKPTSPDDASLTELPLTVNPKSISVDTNPTASTLNTTQHSVDVVQPSVPIQPMKTVAQTNNNPQPKKLVQQMSEPHWEFHVDTKAPFDPLLGCLMILSKLKNKATSERALVAGLPLVQHRLTPDLFRRAALRIGLSSRIVSQTLQEISLHDLPAVLFLEKERACVLVDIREDGMAVIIRPEMGAGKVEISIDDLAEIYEGHVIFLEETYHFDERMAPLAKVPPKHWFWSVFLKTWPLYAEVLVASFLLNLFSIAAPLFTMNVYDRVVPNNATETLWVLAIGVTIVFTFDFLLRSLRSYFLDIAAKKVDIQLSSSTFEQLLNLEMSVRPSSVGSLANTVAAFETFRDFVASASASILVDIPFLLLFVIVMIMLGGSIALVPILIIPIVLLISFAIQIPLQHLVRLSHSYSSEKEIVLIESLSSVETIKGMCSEGQMQRRWEQLTRLLSRLGLKIKTLSNLGIHSSSYIQQLAVVAMIIIGVYKIGQGEMTMGALVACSILLGRALAPISQISGLATRYKQAKASLESVKNVMEMSVERPVNKTFLHKSNLGGDIEFRHVAFQYPQQPVLALKDVSFHIKPGEKVGIIGRTGSGKTSIEKLMMKFYPATEGTILVDGLEIQQLDPAELRHRIGYVPQDTVLFHGTIRDNIVIGAPYVDDTAVLRAAQLSGVDTFVNRHPQGFDRFVAERGQNLSGGQRQAIALARALLLDPPVLIFDEPCTGMDDVTIGHFFSRLKMSLQNKTFILVTHKAPLLDWVDRLIVIEDGQVSLDGPRDAVLKELVKRKEQEAQMKEKQVTTAGGQNEK